MTSHSKLEKFQTDFVDSILTDSTHKELLSDIVPAGTLPSAEEALSAHENGYYARLTEVLGETFEACWFVTGDELFFQLSKDYIKEHPSKTYNLSDYGNHFAEFAQKKLADEIPFIKDLAKFEWIFKNTFHSKQHQALDPQELAVIQTNPDQKIIFGESVSLFQSNYSVYGIWEQRQGNNTEDSDQSEDPFEEKPEQLLIYKQDNQIFVKTVSIGEFKILQALQEGQTFSTIVDLFTEENSSDLIAAFQTLGSTQIIKGTHTK
jgi:hypothetical protein